jgi:hypothetical protein
MVKDRIGNALATGDKVMVELPSSSIIGFVSEVQESGVLRATGRGELAPMPGRVLVSCVIALPVDSQFGAAGGVVKVHDAAKDEKAADEGAKLVDRALREVPKAN